MSHPVPRCTAPAKQMMTNPFRRGERYERIVSAATTLAALGNVDCQIRSVATAAGIAPSTVYRYFTSKDDLLLACLHRWLLDFAATYEDRKDNEFDSYQGVLEVVRVLTASLCSSPRFTEAVIQPYLYARGEACARADIVSQQLIQLFSTAMSNGQPSELHRSVAEVLIDIWVANVVAISQNRSTIDDLMHRLTLVIDALKETEGSAEGTGPSGGGPEGPNEEDPA